MEQPSGTIGVNKSLNHRKKGEHNIKRIQENPKQNRKAAYRLASSIESSIDSKQAASSEGQPTAK